MEVENDLEEHVFVDDAFVEGYLGTEQKGLLLPIPNPSEKNFHLLCGTLTGKVSHKKNEIQIIAWF